MPPKRRGEDLGRVEPKKPRRSAQLQTPSAHEDVVSAPAPTSADPPSTAAPPVSGAVTDLPAAAAVDLDSVAFQLDPLPFTATRRTPNLWRWQEATKDATVRR